MTTFIHERKRSAELFERSLSVIPGGVNSPVRAFFDLSIEPLIVERGKKDIITDIDKRQYIDYCMCWGALILGHADDKVVSAVTEALQKGAAFGIHTELETRLAEKVVDLVPSAEKVRFVNSGTEATMTAIRLARGYTKKDLIIKFRGNYHGHVDALLVKAGSGAQLINDDAYIGVPKDVIKNTLIVDYNDSEKIREIFSDPELSKNIAAVIFEPIAGNMGLVKGTKEFIKTLREETEKSGALLIADEVITGFRLSKEGVSHLHGITPDLICLGKILGGGFPIAAVGGRKEIMDHLAPLGDVYQAGTLSGNPVAVASALRVLQELEQEGFYELLEEKSALLLDDISDALQDTPHSLQRSGSMFTIFFGVKDPKNQQDTQYLDKELFRKYFLYLFERGIYIPPSPFEVSFISTAHTDEHLIYTKNTILSFLEEIRGK